MTDKALIALERKLQYEYRRAMQSASKRLSDHLKKFDKEDAIRLAKVKSGELSRGAYLLWRSEKMTQGEAWKGVRDTLAKDLSNANQIAVGMINENTKNVYALNMNYGTYEVESGARIRTSFTLYDHSTVENLMKKDPKIIPKARLDIPKDMLWNRRKITSAITQGVLSGDSIPDIAKRLRSVTNMNIAASIRNARTYTTAAENKGRIDSYKRAQDLGIEMEQEWMATLDERTRASHVALDGERVAIGEKFSNDLEYPGDPSGDPEEIYNCRCTLRAVIANHEYDRSNRFENLPEGMTYDDWKAQAKGKK